MEYFQIDGGVPLQGSVRVGGAKNAVLPMMAASLLCEGPLRLTNVPQMGDIAMLTTVLRGLGVRADRFGADGLDLAAVDTAPYQAPFEAASKMRASICALGPLLARRGRAEVAHPGGCNIGVRAIDLHIKGLQALGATVDIEGGYIKARAERLRGAKIFLSGTNGPTVLGTENVMMAACLAEGQTVIEDAASEPEVQELAHLLNAMGARIEGIGTRKLTIEGVASLHGVERQVIPDRMEAGTFMLAAAITHGNVVVENAVDDHMSAVLDCMRRIGIRVAREPGGLRISAPEPLRPVEIATAPYPGMPTDMQPQFTTLLACARGTSVITEHIFEERFGHIAELLRMRASITKKGASAVINGVDYLSGAPVEGGDLRATAALVLAGLVAQGQTTVTGLNHLDRGYDAMEQKLALLGARIKRAGAITAVPLPKRKVRHQQDQIWPANLPLRRRRRKA